MATVEVSVGTKTSFFAIANSIDKYNYVIARDKLLLEIESDYLNINNSTYHIPILYKIV
jgi:hypothetical protein